MSNDFQDMSTAPTLTLDPFQTQEEKKVPAAEQQDPELDDSILTEEERRMVDAFAQQIDLTNSTLVLQYGAGTQKKMADFSESALDNVRSKDLGEVGQLLSSVVTELKSFDEEEEKGFLGIFKKASNKIESMKAKYAKAETNVNEIVKVLEKHQVQLMKDTALLDKMYELNLTYFKELSMYILAGKKKLAEVRNTRLKELTEKAQISGLPEDAQAARDLDAMCNRFEKKVHDLELTRMISIQTAPQIRLVQNNDTQMVEKIQSTIVNTIPLWKSQMVLALGVEHSAQAAEAQRQVTDMTNELLKKNAEKLKMSTLETAKASERGIVDIETLKATNESLISTLDEVMTIQREGREKRQAAEAELRNMEQELKGKLLQIQGGQPSA
ncbi:toxic anion resistance protein [Clostridium sp. Marseille-P3244]|uniref:toxic anion resistance protein n=1 Tax=Clostridium sp. Marseille-P3244 TaxID=1871020 RepID=UPI000931A441|nr:toxic anion resistance protein [Clostridium sp. Marseille-P3244]